MDNKSESIEADDALLTQLFRLEPEESGISGGNSGQTQTDTDFLRKVSVKVEQYNRKQRFLSILPILLVSLIVVFALAPYLPAILQALKIQLPATASNNSTSILQTVDFSQLKLGLILVLGLGLPFLFEKLGIYLRR